MKSFTAKRIVFVALVFSICLISCSCSSVKAKPMGPGKWEGNTFKNEWSNMQFTLPDGYTQMPQETLDKLKELTIAQIETYDSEVLKKAVDKASDTFFFDCGVILPDGASSVVLWYQKSTIFANTEDYLDSLKKSVEKQSTQSVPLKCEGKGTMMIKGNDYDTLTFSLNINGIDFKQVYCIREMGHNQFEYFILCYIDTSKPDIDKFLRGLSDVAD